jgi:hypothetical protein
MHTLCLRWEPEIETWVYDDTDIGVVGEPFVLGADKMLTRLRTLQVGPELEPFRVVVSAAPFPVRSKRGDSKKRTAASGTKPSSVTRYSADGSVRTSSTIASAPAAVYVRAEPSE